LHVRINLSLILSLSDTKTVVIAYFKIFKKKGKSRVFPVLALMACRVSKSIKADSRITCCAHAVPLPWRALIHTCHAVPLPCSDSDVSFVKVRVVAGNI